jgi:multidrug efflux pump subunit AcrB
VHGPNHGASVALLRILYESNSQPTATIHIFPEIRIPVVTVIWQYTELSTPEMEQRVTT